jgi:hypothetical protein
VADINRNARPTSSESAVYIDLLIVDGVRIDSPFGCDDHDIGSVGLRRVHERHFEMQAGACDVSQLAEPSDDGHLVLIDREEAGKDQQNSDGRNNSAAYGF